MFLLLLGLAGGILLLGSLWWADNSTIKPDAAKAEAAKAGRVLIGCHVGEEFGVAMIIAGTIGFCVDLGFKKREDRRHNRHLAEIKRNVFHHLLGVEVDEAIVAKFIEALRQPLMRLDLTLRYHFVGIPPAKVEPGSAGQIPVESLLLSELTVTYRLKNIGREPIRAPVKHYFETLLPESKEHRCGFTSFAISQGGEKIVSLDPEDKTATRPEPVLDPCGFFTGYEVPGEQLTLGVKEEVEVAYVYKALRRYSDSETWLSSLPADGLSVELSFDSFVKEEFDFHLDSSRAEPPTLVSKSEYGELSKIDGGILPGHGVLLCWKRKAAAARPAEVGLWSRLGQLWGSIAARCSRRRRKDPPARKERLVGKARGLLLLWAFAGAALLFWSLQKADEIRVGGAEADHGPIWGQMGEEFGVAVIIASAIGLCVDLTIKKREDRRHNRHLDEIKRNVFHHLLAVQVDEGIVDKFIEALQLPLMRLDLTLRYHFVGIPPAKVEPGSAGQIPVNLLLFSELTVTYRLKNIGPKPIKTPVKHYFETLLPESMEHGCGFTSFEISQDGEKLISLNPEDKTATRPEPVHDLRGFVTGYEVPEEKLTLGVKEAVEVAYVYKALRRWSDSETWLSSLPADGLSVEISLDSSVKDRLAFHLDSSRVEPPTLVSKSEYGELSKIDGGILPGHGVLVCWKPKEPMGKRAEAKEAKAEASQAREAAPVPQAKPAVLKSTG